MSAVQIVFWVCLGLVFYSYAGYGVLLLVLVSIKKLFIGKKKGTAASSSLPPVAIIVAAYNEEDFIRLKIGNTLQLDYPQELLELIFVTDGSTDNTPSIISEYPGIHLLHQPGRKGKIAAVHRALEYVK